MRDMEEAESYARNILVGDDVYLRPLREDDLDVLEQWWADSTVAVFQHQAIRPQPSGSASDLFRLWSTNKDSSGVGFSIARQADDSLLGQPSSTELTSPQEQPRRQS